MKAIILTLCTIAVFASGVLYFGMQGPGRIAAKVGDYPIYAKDITYRDKVIKLYFPEEQRSMGLHQLTASYVYAQLLKKYGAEITEKQLLEESNRIDSTTKNAELLGKIKAVFRSDKPAYLRAFVLPTLADRIIAYEFYPNNPAVHGDREAEARHFLEKVLKEPNLFNATAHELKLPIFEFTLSARDGLRWPEPPGLAELKKSKPRELAQTENAAQESYMKEHRLNEGKDWLANIIPTVKSGQVVPRLLTYPNEWLVARLVAERGGVYQFQGVRFVKEDFFQWVEREKKQIKIETY